MTKPLLLTMGEPAGIGADLCVQLSETLLEKRIVIAGNTDALNQRAETHQQQVRFSPCSHSLEPKELHEVFQRGDIAVMDFSLGAPVHAGTLDEANAEFVLSQLRKACLATQAGKARALITAPIHKAVLDETSQRLYQQPFTGHTEFFEQLTNAAQSVMLLASDSLKVALLTTHIPIHTVTDALTPELIERVIRVIDADFRSRFTSGRAPKIGLCGLNPHAGESGKIGTHDRDVIAPTAEKLREAGIDISAPLPADTLFVPRYANDFDVIVACYHDQGLPVIKAQSFGQCANITLGLPIIRTSVDHGTALDLAGTNRADTGSLNYAIKMAEEMSKHENISNT